MAVNTLITDGFDEGGEWLDADDRAVLIHAMRGVIEKHVVRREEASKARMAEPEDMTVLYVVGAHDISPKIWIRDDTKRRILEGDSMPEARWQREGDQQWFTWRAVIGLSGSNRLTVIYGRSQW